MNENWTAVADSSLVYLQTQLASPSPFGEYSDRPTDGIAYHAMLQVRSPLPNYSCSSYLKHRIANGAHLANRSFRRCTTPVRKQYDPQ